MELAEKLCSLLEPKPADTPPFDEAFTSYLNGRPITTPGGFWQCLTIYDKGDVPTWYPIPVDKEWGAMGKVVDEMLRLGYTMSLYTADAYSMGEDESNSYPTAYVYHGGHVTVREGAILPEAVAKASLFALGAK
jgi:hypothetical protein